jgi:hypothetical protein
VIEAQELYCHGCGRYVQFRIDLELDGNHVLECPNCGHEHCRVVRGGRITGVRWGRRNGPTHLAATSGTTLISTWSTSTTGSTHLYASWINAGSNWT